MVGVPAVSESDGASKVTTWTAIPAASRLATNASSACAASWQGPQSMAEMSTTT